MTTINFGYLNWYLLVLNSRYVGVEEEFSLGIVKGSIKAIFQSVIFIITELFEAVSKKNQILN